MKIAVNTRLLLKDRLEGIGRFSHEILSRLTSLMPNDEFHFFFDRPFDQEFIYSDNVQGHVIFPQARHPILYNIWFHKMLPRALKKEGIDLLFSPEGYIPLQSKVPCVNVIHDLNFEHHPEMMSPVHRKHFQKYFPKYAEASDKLLTVSEYSKQDLIDTYGISPSKIDIVYNGVSSDFEPLSEERRLQTREQWSHGAPYFIFIGSIHPRKNLERLLLAFDQFKASDTKGYKFIVVGSRAFKNEALDATLNSLSHKDDILFTGRLDEPDMIALLASARALAYTPVFEGFGIPIIEAYRCKTPVLTSAITALPEIAGDAALLVDPFSIGAIKEGLGTLAKDENLCNDLSAKGWIRSKEFSWDSAAEKLKQIIRSQLA